MQQRAAAAAAAAAAAVKTQPSSTPKREESVELSTSGAQDSGPKIEFANKVGGLLDECGWACELLLTLAQ
jgi:Flp pilus assembly protein TadG